MMAVPTSKIRPDKKAHNFGKIGGYGWRVAHMKNLQILLNEWPADLPELSIDECDDYIVADVIGDNDNFYGGFDIYPDGKVVWGIPREMGTETPGTFSLSDAKEMRRVIGIFGEAIKRRAAYPEYKGLPEREENE